MISDRELCFFVGGGGDFLMSNFLRKILISHYSGCLISWQLDFESDIATTSISERENSSLDVRNTQLYIC